MKGKGYFIRKGWKNEEISKYVVGNEMNEGKLTKSTCEHIFIFITAPAH